MSRWSWVRKSTRAGRQAKIYDAKVEFEDGSESPYGIHVVKVMKGDCPLQDFQRQWPVGMLCNASKDRVKGPLMWIKGGTLIDNRFALVMLRQWGDLRKLIDTKMQLNRNQGSPFQNVGFVKKVMLCIARDMDALHSKYGIVHRDLKASNVFLCSFGEDLPDDNPHVKVNVVDYECSLGVVGTRFWRAPEILQQLNDRIPSSEIDFTFMTDVYGYGMMCYELLTGRTPFEGHSPRDYDLVLSGNRPNLSQIDVDLDHHLVVEIIKMCWNHESLGRPTFSEIVKMLHCEDEELQFTVSKLEEEKACIVDALAILKGTDGGLIRVEDIPGGLLFKFLSREIEKDRVCRVEDRHFMTWNSEYEIELSRMFPRERWREGRCAEQENWKQRYAMKFHYTSMYLGLTRMEKGVIVSMLERRQARTEEQHRFYMTLLRERKREPREV